MLAVGQISMTIQVMYCACKLHQQYMESAFDTPIILKLPKPKLPLGTTPMNAIKYKLEKILCVVVVHFLFAANSSGQTQNTERQPKPVLSHNQISRSTDEVGNSDGEHYYLRSGNSVTLPLNEITGMRVALEGGISSKGMTGLVMYRQLSVVSPVRGLYNAEYIQKGSLIETKVVGRGAGTFKTAELEIQPREITVEVSTFMQIGVKDNMRVFLKPGTWQLKLHTLIRSMQYPDGDSWNAKHQVEPLIKGKKFGNEKDVNQVGRYDDRVEGFSYLPGVGPLAYSLVKIGGFWKLLFKRPNVVLPSATELFFHITRIEASYLGGPVPKGSPAPVGNR